MLKFSLCATNGAPDYQALEDPPSTAQKTLIFDETQPDEQALARLNLQNAREKFKLTSEVVGKLSIFSQLLPEIIEHIGNHIGKNITFDVNCLMSELTNGQYLFIF